MFKDKIQRLETQLKQKFDDIRKSHRNSTVKGTKAEILLRDFLRIYLPTHYRIGNGEVIDSFGTVSNQCDIVILDEYHPFTFTGDEPSTFFAEGVRAIIEVKSLLNDSHLVQTLKSSVVAKQLKPKFQNGDSIFTCPPDEKRFVRKIPSILFAYSSELTLKTCAEKIVEFQDVHRIDYWNTLDAVFVIDRGYIINYADGEGASQFVRNGVSSKGWVYFDTKENILFNFLRHLMAIMVRVHRQTPILLNYNI